MSAHVFRPRCADHERVPIRQLLLGVLALILALLATALPAGRAAACSCAMSGTIDERVAASTAAFVGTVVGTEPAAAGDLGPATLYRFEVEASAKGITVTPVVVRAVDGGAACGMTFEPGRRYVIFAHGAPDLLETGLCNGNEELAAGAESPWDSEPLARAQPTPIGTPAAAPEPEIVGEDTPGLPIPLIAFAVVGVLAAAAAAVALGRPRA